MQNPEILTPPNIETVPAGTVEIQHLDLSQSIPVIPLRDIVLYPRTVTPVLLGRSSALNAMARAMEAPLHVAFFTLQRHPKDEEIVPENLHQIGVVGHISSSLALPNNLHKILVESLFSAKVNTWSLNGTLLHAQVESYPIENGDSAVSRQMFHTVRTQFGQYLNLNGDLPRDLVDLMDLQETLEEKVFFLCTHLRIGAHLKQLILDERRMERKLAICQELLRNEVEMNALNRRLEHEVRATIAQNQREYFLTEQIRKLQLEMGTHSSPINPELKLLEEQLRAKKMPARNEKKVLDELRRLDNLHTSSPEYAVVRNYIDWFLNIPWNKHSEESTDLEKVKQQLDQDHFGLKAVKERILEYVAVHQLSQNQRSPILCLAGPPGVGKTSLARSIANALSREFVRISLGGVRDEAEIRGHRKTYIGSMPGRLVQALKKCQSMNPVILLDEIDKLGSDFRGDPAAALLEVLDPEQNHEFIDHFMEIGIDLSKVFFVTTANLEEMIPPALQDRLEVIRISGYYPSEKLAIAKDYLIPRLRSECGLNEKVFAFDDSTLSSIVRQYTREAGVRNLERQIAKIGRKRARQVVENKVSPKKLDKKSLGLFLGVPIRKEDEKILAKEKFRHGTVTGLAWTSSGGEVLRIECSLLSGKGRMNLTGKLGDVMKESAQIALTLVRERARLYGIDPSIFHKTDIHIHLPEGATPKDGPSAGIGLTVALLSAMTRCPVNPRIAFTGEVSLIGKVHAIGGLPEKALAALQAGVEEIYVPQDNKADWSELPKEAKQGLKINQVAHIDTILKRLFKETLMKK